MNQSQDLEKNLRTRQEGLSTEQDRWTQTQKES